MAKKQVAKKIYEVPIFRIGYAHATIKVKAKNAQAAIKTALDNAGNFDYSEHESKYENVDGASIAAVQDDSWTLEAK